MSKDKKAENKEKQKIEIRIDPEDPGDKIVSVFEVPVYWVWEERKTIVPMYFPPTLTVH